MNKIANYFYSMPLLVALIICFSFSDCLAQINMPLPSKSMGLPDVFSQEGVRESYRWEEIASERSWGDKLSTTKPWRVYVDRCGVYARKEAKMSASKVGDELEFMSGYYVIETSGDFALLYKAITRPTSLVIPKDAICVGWVPIDNLLLWSICPKTKGQVFKKAVIVRNVDEMDNTNMQEDDINPWLRQSPDANVKTTYRVSELEFFFVFKKSNGSALLSKECNLENIAVSTLKKGWMSRSLYTDWDTRLCYEPNFGDDVKGGTASVFNDKNDALNYRNGVRSTNKPLTSISLPSERWKSKFVRFPVVATYNNKTAKVATIGGIGRKTVNIDRNDDEAIEDEISAIDDMLGTVNVVFVMDGTQSMSKFFKKMANAIVNVMKRDEMQGKEFHFGAVVYRNYADKDLIEMKNLTSDYNEIANWLSRIDCHSVGKTHYEAMYHGINQAVDLMQWDKKNSNFMILIGDAANKEPDARGITDVMLAQKLADKRINFVAFQANCGENEAYINFAPQVQSIMLKELEKVTRRRISYRDLVEEGLQCSYKYDATGKLPFTSAFRFAQAGSSESGEILRKLVVAKISEFNKIADEIRNRLRLSIEGLSDSSSDAETGAILDEETMAEYFTPQQIEYLKKKNTSLKVEGYTCRQNGENTVFLPAVFFAKEELDELIADLESVSNNITENNRKQLQDAMLSLARSYIGQSKANDDLSVDDIMDALVGITKGTGKSPLPNIIKLSQLTDENAVSSDDITRLQRIISFDVEYLRSLQRQRSCYFDTKDRQRYYYILLSDMPFQDHNQ